MMISKIQKDFLLLFQCIVDFGAEVLRDFTEEKIKIKYKTENFSIFLENTRHYLYHQWEKTKVPCCQCPVQGFNIPKSGRMDKKIYNKLYSFNSSDKCPKGHVIEKDSIIVQNCICRFTAVNIMINELDLSDLNALLVGLRAINTPIICQSEALLINEIMVVRGTVCHAVTTTTFSESELNNLWVKFTNALYSLCPGDKKNVKWLKKTIETTKKTILSEEEVQELMGKIEMQERDVQDISEEVKKIMIDNTADLKNCVINESAGIKAHLDNQIKKCEERIIGRLEHILGSHPVIARAFLSDIRTEPAIERADQRKIAIKGKITQESMTKTNEDNVIRTLPAEIDVTYEDIEEHNEKRQVMHINASKANSIELELEVTAGIFENADVLRMAILTLVKEVVVAAKAYASKEDPIHILLTFESPLTEAETVTVTDFFMNTHQNGNQSQGDIIATIDASSSGSTSSYSECGNADGCLFCCNKEDHIKQLEEKITRLQQFMPGNNDTRIQKWLNMLNEAPSEQLSDSGIDRSENLGFIEDSSQISAKNVHPEDYLKGILDDFDSDQIRWLAVGICLHTVLASALRMYAHSLINEFYKNMVKTENIDKQKYPNYLRYFPKSNGIHLNYEGINKNIILHGRAIEHYDYRVQNAVDVSKLVLPTSMTHYSDFDKTWELLAVLGIISSMEIFPKTAQVLSSEVRHERNQWANCCFQEWDEVRFRYSINVMTRMVRELKLSVQEEFVIVNKIRKWKQIGSIPDIIRKNDSDKDSVSL